MKYHIITDIKYLRQKSKEVPNTLEKHKYFIDGIIKDLEDSLDLNRGIGLSAIQIGFSLKIAIIRMPNLKLDLINPKIIEKNDKFKCPKEGCLSLPGLYIDTLRYRDITLENGDGKLYSLEAIEAIVCQHEISHMQGKLILDCKWRKKYR